MRSSPAMILSWNISALMRTRSRRLANRRGIIGRKPIEDFGHQAASGNASARQARSSGGPEHHGLGRQARAEGHAAAEQARTGALASVPGRTSPSPTTCCRICLSTSRDAASAVGPRPSARSTASRTDRPPGCTAHKSTSVDGRPPRMAALSLRSVSRIAPGHLAGKHHVENRRRECASSSVRAARRQRWRGSCRAGCRAARPVTSEAAQPSPHRQNEISFSSSVGFPEMQRAEFDIDDQHARLAVGADDVALAASRH